MKKTEFDKMMKDSFGNRVINVPSEPTMKVKITQRSVYHKIAQIEIDVPVPKDAFFEEIQEWIIENEDTWIDEIDHKLNEQEFVFGRGMDDDNHWTYNDEDSEWRIDAVRETVLGKMPTGGHL